MSSSLLRLGRSLVASKCRQIHFTPANSSPALASRLQGVFPPSTTTLVRWLSSDDDADDKKKEKRKVVGPFADENTANALDVFDAFFDESPGTNKKKDEDEDPFGIHFQDGPDGLGPEIPPMYKRDTTTGRFTGEVEAELAPNEKRVLQADSMEKDRMLLDRIEEHWSEQGTDKSGLPTELDRLGRRIRETDMATNVMGRSVQAQASKEVSDDGSELGRDEETGFSQRLTKGEFRNFKDFMKEKHKIDVTEDDIPVQDNSKIDLKFGEERDPDDRELALKWLTARAQRQMDDTLDDNPYSDLMPGDLSPTELVSRKRAKQIPTKLLHHNNMSLLRPFISETGQIRSRIQTRLGARDQRRISRLIKRARALGLVPYSGQFKAEQHGWLHEPDIREQRKWERELEERGLVVKSNRRTKE